jgi:hypothetical protein
MPLRNARHRPAPAPVVARLLPTQQRLRRPRPPLSPPTQRRPPTPPRSRCGLRSICRGRDLPPRARDRAGITRANRAPVRRLGDGRIRAPCAVAGEGGRHPTGRDPPALETAHTLRYGPRSTARTFRRLPTNTASTSPTRTRRRPAPGGARFAPVNDAQARRGSASSLQRDRATELEASRHRATRLRHRARRHGGAHATGVATTLQDAYDAPAGPIPRCVPR